MFYHCWHDYLWTDPSVERYGEQGQPSMSILLHSWQDLQVHSYGFDTESCLRTIPWSSSMSMGRPSLQSIPCSSTLWPRSIEEEFLERSSWLWYPCLPSCSSQSWCLQIPSSSQESLHVSEVLPSVLHLCFPSSMSSEASLQNFFPSTWFCLVLWYLHFGWHTVCSSTTASSSFQMVWLPSFRHFNCVSLFCTEKGRTSLRGWVNDFPNQKILPSMAFYTRWCHAINSLPFLNHCVLKAFSELTKINTLCRFRVHSKVPLDSIPFLVEAFDDSQDLWSFDYI